MSESNKIQAAVSMAMDTTTYAASPYALRAIECTLCVIDRLPQTTNNTGVVNG